MKIEKILVPVDFSEFSDRAVKAAIQLGEKFDAQIALLHVITLFHEDVDEETRLKNYEKKIEGKLGAHKTAATKKGVGVKSTLLRGFSAADIILEYVEQNDFGLIVMGSHGRTGIKHLLHGSVSERVVRLSSIPVLTIHHSIKEFSPKKILVPVDFSKFSKVAVDRGNFWGELFGAKIIFLHVIEQFAHPAFYAANVESLFQIDQDLKDRTTQKLREFVGKKAPNGEYLVAEGKAYSEIVDCANEKDVDLIVMATRGLTGLDYFLMGSTAERVARMAECSVLTVARSEKITK